MMDALRLLQWCVKERKRESEKADGDSYREQLCASEKERTFVSWKEVDLLGILCSP